RRCELGPADRVHELVEPILARLGLELFDVEQKGPILRVSVDRAGGIDLDALSDATRAVSNALDEADPMPGRYTLEVSSPGLERKSEEESRIMSKNNFEFFEALQTIAREKAISVEVLLDALANALVAAYKRLPNAAEEAVVTVDPDTGEIKVYGQELDEDGNVVREWDDTPKDFGRIAAQTAKQVILQRIREAERDLKYEEYAGREGDIVTGIIQQSDNRYTLLDLGKVEA